MANVVLDGMETRYEEIGSGEPLLMYSPGGFDATIEKWRNQGVYAIAKFLDHLPGKYRCILFDRRETGMSGGRVERIGWSHYVKQGIGLLDHLGIRSAHVMGGCMGCSAAIAFGTAHPDRTRSLVLFWPVGGARYRLSSHQRFAEHLAFVNGSGLAAVVELARTGRKSFGADPRGGPWASVLARDPVFSDHFVQQNPEHYRTLVAGMGRTLFDRDTAPGAEPEDLLRLDIPTLVVPGSDGFHATSAARYLQECIPGSDYWDQPVPDQTEETVAPRVLTFLTKVDHAVPLAGTQG